MDSHSSWHDISRARFFLIRNHFKMISMRKFLIERWFSLRRDPVWEPGSPRVHGSAREGA